MAVFRACYCTRADIMSATDIKLTQDNVRHIDSALEGAADDVDALTNRRFWNAIETGAWDWPSYNRGYPWRIWLDAFEVADQDGTGPLGFAPVLKTGVQSASPTTVPLSSVFWRPRNYGPPWNAIELNRASGYSFGQSDTPQEDVSLQAVRGYWTKTKPGGTLAATVSDTASTTVTVSDSSVLGVGDVLIAGTEQMLVQDAAMADTGQAQTGSGCSTDSPADNILAVADGTKIHAGEYLQLDAEWMLAESVTVNNVTVVRAVLGTQIADHTSAAVYAMRSLTVERGFGGTTAATHTSGDALLVSVVPGMVRELAIAEALNYVFQKTSAYARTIGENGARTVPGGSLPDLRSRVYTRYGRKARQRVI
jgi:hypothetical protein